MELDFTDENVGPINAPVKAFKQQERNAIDDVIRSVLESIRVIMINGTDTIPPLDPFFIENLLVNFTSADAQYSTALFPILSLM